MRLLAAAKMVDEVDVNTYAANDLTKAFLQPGICDAVIHGYDSLGDDEREIVSETSYADQCPDVTL